MPVFAKGNRIWISVSATHPSSGFHRGSSFQLNDFCSKSHTTGCQVAVRGCCGRQKISGEDRTISTISKCVETTCQMARSFCSCIILNFRTQCSSPKVTHSSLWETKETPDKWILFVVQQVFTRHRDNWNVLFLKNRLMHTTLYHYWHTVFHKHGKSHILVRAGKQTLLEGMHQTSWNTLCAVYKRTGMYGTYTTRLFF